MAYTKQRTPPYKPGQSAPYKLSRSKIELYMQCPRCFWLDVRLKIKRPSSPPFRINSAIDELLKKEFDVHRHAQTVHPLTKSSGLELVPFKHDKMEEWRDALRRGISCTYTDNLLICGGVDDVWEDKTTGELVIVDYKATSKSSEVNIDSPWQISYKRQLEVYQWLFRQNGFKVSDTGYFVYANGRVDVDGFYDKIEFRTKIIPYTGNDSWIEPTLQQIKACMESEDMPPVGKNIMDAGKPCEFCAYARKRTELTLKYFKK